MKILPKRLRTPFWIRLFRWEYWSFHAIYGPIYLVWLFLCARARSFFFFGAANPHIENGGFLAESKKDIYGLAPDGLQPRTIFFSEGVSSSTVQKALASEGLDFPLIAKPNTGARGRGVMKLESAGDLAYYLEQVRLDFHIQEFIEYPLEVGIFYYRYPNQPAGRVSGIVGKVFLSVTGDGSSTVRDLLLKTERGVLQLEALERKDPQRLLLRPREGECITVVPYGNHARGAQFLDYSHKIDEALCLQMDRICQQIPYFYYGRLDIRYRDWETFKKGEGFRVIEINGAGSEPTHIYDPHHSIFFAWKEIIRHWKILYRVSRINHLRGYPYLSLKQAWAMYQKDKWNSSRLNQMQV